MTAENDRRKTMFRSYLNSAAGPSPSALAQPSKAERRKMLEDAARNTAEIPLAHGKKRREQAAAP